MKHLHLTQDLLRAALDDHGQIWQITPTVMAHLLSLCPICRQEVEAWDREVAAGSTQQMGLSGFGLPSLWAEKVGGGGDEEKRAAAQLQMLLILPQQERLRFVQQSESSFRGKALAQALLDEAASQLPAERWETRAPEPCCLTTGSAMSTCSPRTARSTELPLARKDRCW